MKKVLLLSLAALLSLSASAQLLWKVSGNGITRPSYIFGTHHLAPADSVLDANPAIDESLASVDEVLGEIVLADMAAAQNEVLAALQAPADSTLSTLLTPAQLDSVNNVLSAYTSGMLRAEMLNAFKPAMLSTQLEALRAATVFPGFNPMRQLDGVIQEKGSMLGKRIGGLETVAYQIGMLYGSPLAQQAADLMKSVRLDESSRQLAVDLANAYIAGNLDAMHDIMMDPDNGMTDDEATRLIYNRNRAWVSFLVGALTTTPMFIAVGAGHLPGAQGLISLLRSEGYDVEPVK